MYQYIYIHIFSYGPTKCDHDGISCFQGMLTQRKNRQNRISSKPSCRCCSTKLSKLFEFRLIITWELSGKVKKKSGEKT